MNPRRLTICLKEKAFALGFDTCRIVPIHKAPHIDFFQRWLNADRAGEMTYLERYVEKRRNPGLLAENGTEPFRSLIVLAVNYHQFDLPPELRDDPSRGIIASYAWGDDYHELIRPLLYELDEFLRRHTGRQERGKCLVDTGPVLERDWAALAGVGFTGKNCCTIHPHAGSWLFLATILVPEELVFDVIPQSGYHALVGAGQHVSPVDVLNGLPPEELYGTWTIPLSDESQISRQTACSAPSDSTWQEHSDKNTDRLSDAAPGTCGRCTRCMDKCPTNAFVGPFHLNPAQCIAYWTIEAKGAIPRELRHRFGNRIFGCDICQEVCPWNQRLETRKPRLPGLHAQHERVAPPLLDGFQIQSPYWLDSDAFRAHFRHSPIKRAKRPGMLRNVCVALGNWADPITVPPLAQALHDPTPLVRGHAAWALGQVRRRHPSANAVHHLVQALDGEQDEWVREEIAEALS